MTSAKIVPLEDRGVVAVTGGDARKFLQGLVTNDMDLLNRQPAMFAALLSPQGKVLFDFFVIADGDGYLLDVARDQAAALTQRLTMYKLRANVAIADVSAAWSVTSIPDDSSPLDGYSSRFADPRNPALGWRALQSTTRDVQARSASTVEADRYHAHRIALGVPEGGGDYAWGDVFPHEAMLDHLHGVSFTKGCYVGQEIVARMEHRGTARRRIVRVTGAAELPRMGTSIVAGEAVIGTMGSHAGTAGLAMLRLDRVMEFNAKDVALTAGGTAIVPVAQDVARLAPKATEAH